MASDIFAKIGDIKGESPDDKHKGEIEVRLGMVLTEEHRPLQTVRRFVQVAVFELSQAEVQE